MTFDELQALADKDLKMNDTELDLESLKTPQLHNKYMKFHNQYTNLLKKAEQDLARLTREKWEYYTGKADPSVYQLKPFNLKILKQDVDKYLKSDDGNLNIPFPCEPIHMLFALSLNIQLVIFTGIPFSSSKNNMAS